MIKKIAMSGGHGRVGRLLAPHGVVDLGCDVTNPLEVQHSIKYLKPNLIIHLASHSEVDWCEQHVDESVDVNFLGASNVVTAAEQIGCPVVLFSSDHVFDGRKWWGRYKEKDERFPLNTYGMAKVAAEGLQGIFDNIKIIRTSFLFDYDRLKWQIYNLEKGYSEGYPTFIRRSFMYYPHFIKSFLEYLSRFDEMPDVLHISGSEVVSWHQFMSMVANKFGLDMTRVVARTKDIGGHAPRGHRLGLNVSLSKKLGLPQFGYLEGIEQMKVDSGR